MMRDVISSAGARIGAENGVQLAQDILRGEATEDTYSVRNAHQAAKKETAPSGAAARVAEAALGEDIRAAKLRLLQTKSGAQTWRLHVA